MLTDLDYELLSAYIDGALTESERTAFELRLQAEPELSRELDELRATITLLNNLPLRKAPRNFTLDVRYGRRSSVFFTSAAFSALSSAAAVILFALGAYLFIGRGNNAAPSASTAGQEAQLAFRVTSTSATMDKAAATTATLPLLQNEIILTDTQLISPLETDGLTANDALAQGTLTAQPSQLPIQPPLFQADAAQATEQTSEGFSSGSAPASAPPSDSQMQQRTDDATQSTNQQYAAPGTDGGLGGAAPASPMEETEANAASALAATQLPFAATLLPTARPMPTATLAPTATLTPTNTTQPTATVTPLPTAALEPVRDASPAPDSLPLLFIGLGIVFLLIALGTSILRRRNRK